MSSTHDFDFLHGTWNVHHRKLRERLTGCDEWDEFTGRVTGWPVLGGDGNVDDNLLDDPKGTYRAVAMRSFDPVDAVWSIWWLDQRTPRHLDPPVVGSFRDGVGTFLADDTLAGRPIRVRFTWLDTTTGQPRWEQAFSTDAGARWETNWQMWFTRQSESQRAAGNRS